MADALHQLEELTRRAVCEVFQSMVSMDVTAETPASITDVVGEIVGSVGFVGDVTNGVIHLYTGVGFARKVTSQMLGIPLAEVESDEMINDAVGELSNMVAGYVKARLGDGRRACLLTIPSIVRGKRLSVEGSASVTRSILGFRNGDAHFLVELLLKDSPK